MKFKLWAGFILVLLVLAGGTFGWWYLFARGQPKTIVRHQTEIAQLLAKSGWVAPPGQQGGPKLYQIGFRACPDCIRYRHDEWPKLHKAGVDTRQIMVARPDSNGQAYSSPAERSTVAELWVNRSWDLMQRWDAVPPAAWTAPGILPADGDAARTAVVDQSRRLIENLTPMLKANGVITREFCYPMLIWWDKQGRMRASGCAGKRADRYIRKDLGA
jgi:hypothetical protein